MTDGITFDKPAYNIGDTITATVVLSGRSKSDTAIYTSPAGTLTATTKIVASGSLTDSLNKTWKTVSDDGVTAVFTTTA